MMERTPDFNQAVKRILWLVKIKLTLLSQCPRCRAQPFPRKCVADNGALHIRDIFNGSIEEIQSRDRERRDLLDIRRGDTPMTDHACKTGQLNEPARTAHCAAKI